MHTSRCYWTNRTGRTYSFSLKKSYGESGKVKFCYAFHLKSRPEKAANIVQLVFDSEKTSAEPPERMFLPPENKPPERKPVPPERKFVLDTSEFMPRHSRQTSSREDFYVDTFFSAFQIAQHISIANALYSSFHTMKAQIKRCCA